RALVWIVAVLTVVPSAAFAESKVFQGGCSGNWSDGNCWGLPPENIPPVAGDVVAIAPGTTATLDVSASPLDLFMAGNMNQSANDLSVGVGLTVVGLTGTANYQFSGGTITTDGLTVTNNGVFTQSGGTANAVITTISSVNSGTATYNLVDGNLNSSVG